MSRAATGLQRKWAGPRSSRPACSRRDVQSSDPPPIRKPSGGRMSTLLEEAPAAARPRPFVPYIAAGTELREFSWRAVLMGTILGAIFGASSLYLVLKVGLTVSASIPVAVISMTLFKVFRLMGAKDATILENNIAQTAGSAGESIAFGVGVTMPAIMILGFDLELVRVALVSVLGAVL